MAAMLAEGGRVFASSNVGKKYFAPVTRDYKSIINNSKRCRHCIHWDFSGYQRMSEFGQRLVLLGVSTTIL